MRIISTRFSSIILISIMVLLLVSCVMVNNPFKAKTGTRETACNVNASLPVELERAKFDPPIFWSQLKPCELVKISRQFSQDKWGVSAALNYSYGDVIVLDSAMGFSVRGNLNLIGSTPATMEGWKQREDKKWLKHLKYRGDFDQRKIFYENRNGLDCWRTETITYVLGSQWSSSIEYDCWSSTKETLPPLTIGGWIGYRSGKPLYDLDIDKDLIDPAFATLEVKDIKPEVYAERMAIHEEKVKQECKRRIKRVKKNPGRAISAHSIERLEFCGYDTSKLKLEEE